MKKRGPGTGQGGTIEGAIDPENGMGVITNTVECYYAIGRVLERMGKYWRAKPYLEHALKFNRKILGEEHPTTAQSYGMMGKLYISQKKYEKAVECYRHAYEIFEHTLGPDDQLTGMAKETLENAEKEIR